MFGVGACAAGDLHVHLFERVSDLGVASGQAIVKPNSEIRPVLCVFSVHIKNLSKGCVNVSSQTLLESKRSANPNMLDCLTRLSYRVAVSSPGRKVCCCVRSNLSGDYVRATSSDQ